MRGGRRPNCGRRGLKTIACRIPLTLYETINGSRREGETFPQAALRIVAPGAVSMSARQVGAREASDGRG